MIVVVIKQIGEGEHYSDSVCEKKFFCEHCGKLMIYYAIMPLLCERKRCRKPLPNIKALMQMPSAKISWHKGTTDLLCYP